MRVTTLILLLAAGPVVARGELRTGSPTSQDPSPAATGAKPRGDAAPAAALALARALLPQQQWDRLLDSFAASLSGQVSQSLRRQGEKVPDDLQASVRRELADRLEYGRMVEAQAQALADQLTPDELKRTAEFYASPVGKKVLDKIPDAQAQAGEDLQAQLATAIPEIVQRLAPKALAGPEQGTGSGETDERPEQQR